jgi:hypothetical protein
MSLICADNKTVLAAFINLFRKIIAIKFNMSADSLGQLCLSSYYIYSLSKSYYKVNIDYIPCIIKSIVYPRFVICII